MIDGLSRDPQVRRTAVANLVLNAPDGGQQLEGGQHLDRQQALTLQTQGPFKARVAGTVYDNLFIKSLNEGSATAPTVTLLMPTPIGEPDRFRTWRLDQVEVVE